MIAFFLLLAAAEPAPTVIRNATGSLREWQLDPADPAALYVRDRTLRWYHVRLSGDCPRHRRYDAVRYTTDPTGTFDTFSRVTFTPNLTCGVRAIERSAPPASVKRRR